MPIRRRGRYEPARLVDLSGPGASALSFCMALPPRRAGPVRLDDWWLSFGAGFTRAEARIKARGEAIERACAVFQGQEATIRASYRALGTIAIHPDHWLLWSEAQRRARPVSRSPLTRVPPRFEEGEPLEWTAARSLTSGEQRYVPTMAVYFRYPTPPSHRYCPADSNGLAAGRSRTHAALHALLELVERDSVALWWYNRTRRPPYALARARDPRWDRLQQFLARQRREAWVLDLTSDLGIPVCAAVSRRREGPEDLAFGFGAAPTGIMAARRALTEMALGLAIRRAGSRGGFGTAPFERWRRGARIEQHPFLRPEPSAAASRPSYKSSATARLLRWCVRRLEQRGLDVVVCDLTRTDARLAVVRVFAPGLRHFWPRFGPGRLYDGPVAAGWRHRALREAELNPVPLLL